MTAKGMNDRKLIVEIRRTLDIIRNLLKDNMNQLNKIDKAYEETLLNDMRIIPEQYDDNILEIITVAKVVLQNINFSKMNKELQSIKTEYYFEPNTYQTFESCMDKIQMNRLDRARVMNIVRKFKPLFECIDTLISKPIHLIFRIGVFQDQSNNNYMSDVFD